MSCGRCGNDQVGGVQNYPCKDKVDKLKRDILALEACLVAASTPPRPPRPCRCCCCCCHHYDNTTGNQTSWGR